MLDRRQFATAITLGLATGVYAKRVLAQVDAQNSRLFPGERVIDAAGFPALVKIIAGPRGSTLVVFVPGTSFLARIAYGFPGGRPEDFLAHWIASAGYSFLGVSYPLDNPVYERVYPGFGITDWGRQIAAAAREAVESNGLSRRIIVVGWSMGGKPVATVARAAREMGLEVSLFVALDALPPGPNLFPGNVEQFRLASDGMVDQSTSLMPWFLQMVDEQNKLNGHTIIPANHFQPDFTGNPPLDIQGENQRFADGRIVTDANAAAADSAATDYGLLPPIALIISNSTADYPNVLLCRSNWGLFVGQQLYRRHVYPMRDMISGMSPARWADLQSMFAGAVQRLTIQVVGTHFLFLGRIGARRVALAILELERRSTTLDRDIIARLKHDT
jgi:pimeloyl-ACP methyl ester carboxylesterase